jgi:threonine dehydrogenase-like Zn-dependent dehydrogenase
LSAVAGRGAGDECKNAAVRAVRNTEQGVRVVDVPVPDDSGVRVRVRSAGICGSDLEMVRTGLSAATIGHEFAGELDDGTTVAVHPFVACGECEYCGSGRPYLCRTVSTSMLGIFVDGGMTDELRVDDSCLAPLPPGVPVEDASLVEPIAVAVHAYNRGGIAPGMRIGVIGAGTIGLLCGAVARDLGADVGISARHEVQRHAAEALGLAIGVPRNSDVVIEASGTATGFDDAVKHCRRAGALVLVSTTWEPISISFLNAQMRELTIVPAFVYGEAHGEREFDTAVRFLAAHPEIPPTLITHRFGLDDAPHAFDVAADRAHGAIKVVLHP